MDLLTPQGEDIYSETRFKGNMDIDKLAHIIETKGAANIPFCMITVTNNAGGGQPLSMENIKLVKEILKECHIPLVIDCCRIAENSYFIKEYEPGFADRSLIEIAKEMIFVERPGVDLGRAVVRYVRPKPVAVGEAS